MSAAAATVTRSEQWADAAPVLRLLGRLRGAGDVRQLLARASALACEELPFDRALVVSVSGHVLTAEDCGALEDPASDILRRRILAEPVELSPRSAETVALGRPGPVEGSVLGLALGERAVAVAGIAPEGTPLALLAVFRDGPAPDAAEQAGLEAFAHGVSLALQAGLRRACADEVTAELRHLMVSAAALLEELHDAPLVLPSRRGTAPSAPWPAPDGPPHATLSLLSEREVEIVERLVAGRSNREIADELFLSPDTVKGHVARILRKLKAANRVEVVSKYLALTQGTER